jgi:uncharacterized protein
MNRRRFVQTILASGVAALGSGYALAEGHRFEINRHKVILDGLKTPVRVAHLTDLHFDRWRLEGGLRPWVEATLRERPDLIVLTGDFVSRLLPAPKMQGLARALAPLRAPLGVWGVLGNHDYDRTAHSISPLELVKLLEGIGISVLTNTHTQLREDLTLAGIDDLLRGKPNVSAALEGVSQGTATLLMSHNPDMLPKIPGWVGLTLSGHTHGGQIRLPGLPTIVNASEYGERFQMGFVTADHPGESGAKGFVSRGLGTGGFPVRTFCPAELVLLECVPKST